MINGRGKGKHQELEVLWNNGYSEWKRYPTVLRIAPDQVKEYLDRDKELNTNMLINYQIYITYIDYYHGNHR